MTKPVTKTETLVTDDGVAIDAVHLPGDPSVGIVVAHGFTQDWQRPGVWKVAKRFSQFGGVIVFDFRGHGRSGG
jgi:pimeloyl-ACP methyl ester carboxylesterase